MLTAADDSENDGEMSDKFDEFQKEVYIMSHLQHPCLVRVRKQKRRDCLQEELLMKNSH
jgi:hypothetical protein